MFEILLAFSQNKDWKKSFYEVIPPRKVNDDDTEAQSHDTTPPQSSAIIIIDSDEPDDQLSPLDQSATSDQVHTIPECDQELDDKDSPAHVHLEQTAHESNDILSVFDGDKPDSQDSNS